MRCSSIPAFLQNQNIQMELVHHRRNCSLECNTRRTVFVRITKLNFKIPIDWIYNSRPKNAWCTGGRILAIVVCRAAAEVPLIC